ncbi:minor capsid protein [Pediococcus pentosaceus]|uniref:minor capsid protein n=1 Tax=Pediococcus pentosaceus TaxID=1255 RepID=UPI001C7D2EF0|nr:minor capsid protein [Pediococcus pentosaceus]QYY86105.1 capsid protein [Pediococcus pentosaceus]
MAFDVNLNLSDFEQLPDRFDSGEKSAVNQAMMEMKQFVPKRSNALRDSATMNASGHTIVYHAPYAKAQFDGLINGHRVRHYTTPGTSRRWDLRVKGDKGKMANIEKAFVEGSKL